MDPTNPKYNEFSKHLKTRRDDPNNQWNENDKSILFLWFTMINEDPNAKYMSYSNMISIRFIFHLLWTINCLICGSANNFGVNNNYCDTCIYTNYSCPGVEKCKFRVFFNNSSKCPHVNLMAKRPEKALLWNYILSFPLRPENLRPGSGEYGHFDCPTCKHTYKMQIKNTKYNSCYFCNSYDLCKDYTCVFCYNKSFASHPKSQFWDYVKNYPFTPRDVTIRSGERFFFNCNICTHSFDCCVHDVVGSIYCRFCYSLDLCNERIDCKICEKRSFAMNKKAKYWSRNNLFPPRHYAYWSSEICKFFCKRCNHEFASTLNNVSRGQWCPHCVNKTETKLLEWLNTIIPPEYIRRQAKFDWCRKLDNNKRLSFDFLLYDFIIIELDGLQHFQQVHNWQSPEENQEIDIHKMKKALEKGYPVIRLLQEDVWYDRFDWKTALYNAIQTIYKNPGPQVIYIENPSVPSKYEPYRQAMSV